MYITVAAPDHAHAEVALEAGVFRDRFGNTAAELAAEYQPYAGHSLFLGCWTRTHELAGAMRITIGHGGALKTFDDLGGPPWSVDAGTMLARAGIDPSRCWDIATISVPRRAARPAGGDAATCLYRALYVWSVMSKVQAWTAMLDDHVLAMMRDQGIPFQLLPGAFSAPYLGSPQTSPVYAEVEGVAAAMARTAPHRHATLGLGQGMADLDLSALAPVDLSGVPARRGPLAA